MSLKIKSEPTTKSAHFDPIFADLRDFLQTEFSSEYFQKMLLSYVFRPSVVKYGILGNNRRSKLHAVIDYLFYSVTPTPKCLSCL